jgi:general secretion pathway protein A
MYESFFGLTERPFDLTPNWRYLYLSPMHKEALSAIQYGVTARRGIVAVIGEAGTGKTTIVRASLRALRAQGVRQVYLSNPRLTRNEFLRFLSRTFRLPPAAAEDKSELIASLTARLTRFDTKGRAVVLVVDEAQSMPHDLLEEIRLLANIETSTAKLLQVVLVGQPELAERLNDPSLRQLKQRVAIRATLRTLDLRSTAALIAGRIRVAGGRPAEVFTPRAVETVFYHSGGIARTVNVICDNALLSGFAADQRPIGHEIVEEVCRDFDLPRRVDPSVAVEPKKSLFVSTPPKPAGNGNGASTSPIEESQTESKPAKVAPAASATRSRAESVGLSHDLFAMSRRRRPSLFSWIRG